MIWRYALLILLTTGIGAFSGLIDPVLIARAAILNLCLALSFPLLGWMARGRLDAGEPPRFGHVFGAGIAAGLAATVLLAGQHAICPLVPHSDEFIMVAGTPDGWRTGVVCLIYGLGLHAAWHVRWRGRWQRWVSLPLVIVAFCLAGAARGVMTTDIPAKMVDVAMLYALAAGLPLGLLWAILLPCLDPMWSLKRWRKLRPPAEPGPGTGSAPAGAG